MQQRPIGNRTVSAIGLGEMPLSIEGRPDRRQAVATIHASLDAGVTIIDTADAYSLSVQEHGHGEELVAEALAAYPGATDDVIVATKGGHRRPGDGSWTVHGDPHYVKEACEASLKRLGVDAIGLYQYHRPDPKVPWAESVGALADLLDEGKILMAGVSNATVAQIDEAQQVLGRAARERAEPVLAASSAPRRASSSTARSSASSSSRGARWAASAGPTTSSTPTPPSPPWPKRSAPAPSRSPSPGCSPRAPASSRSPAAAAPRPPSPPPPQRTSNSPLSRSLAWTQTDWRPGHRPGGTEHRPGGFHNCLPDMRNVHGTGV